jgi:Flp pilus assembly protein TadG
MKHRIRKLAGEATGSTAIEFAVALPALVTIIWSIFQTGLIFQANAGVQHALGEAARYATLFPTPTDAQIQARITAKKFGVQNGTWNTPVIDNTNVAPANGGYKTITVTYSQPTDFLFFNGPTVNITKSKIIYLSL